MARAPIDRPITVDEACSLRLLLFGDTKKTFNSSWMKQSFTFDNDERRLYRLVQKKPGPCGLLAAVQANVICEALFAPSSEIRPADFVIQMGRRKDALVHALSYILLQASRYSKVVLAVQSRQEVFDQSVVSGVLRKDGMMEFLHLKTFGCKKSLEKFLDSIAHDLMLDGKGSCVTFLYSVILTKGIASIKKEMDHEDIQLIGNDGYCTQEVVNLLLTGRAVTNVFDGVITLNSGGTETTEHRGIKRKSRVGLLSLYEFHNMLEVGDSYKCPRYPIWVVATECHFSTIYAYNSDALKSDHVGSFLLRHIDGLSKRHSYCLMKIEIPKEIKSGQESGPEEIKSGQQPGPEEVEGSGDGDTADRELSWLEKCILTKWPRAKISPRKEK